MAELKAKVVRGFAWNAAEKIGSALFQIYVSVKLLNRISPEEYGVMAILLAFFVVFNTFVDSGFSQALIRRDKPSDADFSSAFYFNIGISVLVYAILVGLAWPSARVFDMPELVELAPVFYLIVPLGAFSIIQQTVLTRKFDFRRLSAVNLTSVVAGGVAAIVFASAGWGVWALVGQRLVHVTLRAVLMWFFGKWRPAARFSGESIRGMYRYSSRILATDMINNLYGKVPQFVIGNIHKETLGNYDVAQKIKDLPVSSTMNSMQAVTFPALSNLRHDDSRFTGGVGKVVSSIVFIMFPMMAGLIAVAGDFFGLFIRDEWQGAVPFFRILCLTGMMIPVTIISNNVMKARSDGGAVVRTEVIKKLFATLILAATIPFGAVTIAWGQVAIAFTDMMVSFTRSRRFSDYGFGRLLRDVVPALALTAVMYAAVCGVGVLAADMKLWIGLVLKISVGVGVYFGGAALFRLDAFGEFVEVVRKVAGKARS